VTPATPSICVHDSISLSASGANVYSWSPAIGLSSTTGITVIAFPLDTTTYTVTGTDTVTGCSNSINTTVVVFPRPVITNNPLTANVCSGDYSNLVVLTSSIGGTTYSWTASSNDGVTGFFPATGSGNILSQQLLISDTIPGHLTYIITPSSNGCPGTPANYIFTVNPTPTVILPPTQTICNGDTSVLVPISSNISTATISWLANYNHSLISGPTAGGSGNIPPQIIFNSDSTAQSVTYHVTASLNGCDSSLDYVITVNPSPTVIFSLPPNSICSGQTTIQNNLSTSTPNATIKWSAIVPVGISGADTAGTNVIQSQNLINNTYGPLTIIYYAKATTTNGATCPGVISTDSLTVKPKPDIIATAQPDTICSAGQINIHFSSHVSGTTFSWSSVASPFIQGNSAGSGSSITDTLTNTGTTPLIVTYHIQTIASGCPGGDTSIFIVVNPVPVVQFSPLGPQTICDSGQTQLVQITSPTTGVAITWTANIPSSITGATVNGGSTIPVQTLFNSSNSILQIIYNVSVGYLSCPGIGNAYIINVNPTTHVTNSDTLQNHCSDDTTNAIYFIADVSNSSFTWNTSGNPNLIGYILSGTTDSLPRQTISNITNQTQCLTYNVIPSFAGCQGVPQEFKICISPRPVISLNLDTQTICTNNLTSPIIASSNIVGTTFTWAPTSSSDTFVTGIIPAYNGDTLPSHVLINTSNVGDTGYVYYSASPTVGGCSGANGIAKIEVLPSPGIDWVRRSN